MQVTTTVCPSCLPAAINFLANQPGTYETFCFNKSTNMRGPHKWDDRELLNATMAAAKAAYPQNYAAPQAQPQSAAPKDIYIDPETKKAMEDLLKQTISGSGDLKGLLFDAIRTAEDAQKELTKLRATVETMKKYRGNAAPGQLASNQVVITIPEWAESEVDSFAEVEEKSRQDWLSGILEEYLENFCTQKQGA